MGRPMDRREFLRRAQIAGAALTLPGVLAACAPEREEVQPSGGPEEGTLEGAVIKVGTYGGFFEENFSKMYPKFTKETGVEVESVSEPTSEQWVVQLEQARSEHRGGVLVEIRRQVREADLAGVRRRRGAHRRRRLAAERVADIQLGAAALLLGRG